MIANSTLDKDYTEIELVNACGIGDSPAFIEVYFILSTRSYSKKSLRKAMCKTIESGNFKTFELLASKTDVPKFELLPHWIGFKV